MANMFLYDGATPNFFFTKILRTNFPQSGLEGEKSAEKCDFRENERAPA